MPHSSHPFPLSLPIIKRVGPDPQLDPHDRDDYLDKSLAVLGESQQFQDKGICHEFKQQRRYMDERFDEQRKYMDGRFDEQRKYMDGRFDEQRKYMDGRFDEQRRYMDGRFDDIDQRFEEARAVRFNSLCCRAHDTIRPIPRIKALSKSEHVLQMPSFFPKNVAKFWELTQPAHGQSHTHGHSRLEVTTGWLTRYIVDNLIYLAKFYQIEGYRDWEDSGDAAFDWDPAANSNKGHENTWREQALEDAVRRHPDRALGALAQILGLVYKEIQRCMDNLEHHRQLQSLNQAPKRPPSSGDSERQPKKPRDDPSHRSPRRSSSFLKFLLMTVSEELRLRDQAERSKSSKREKIYWHDPEIAEHRDRLMAQLMARETERSLRSERKPSAEEQPEVPTELLSDPCLRPSKKSSKSEPSARKHSSQATRESQKRPSKPPSSSGSSSQESQSSQAVESGWYTRDSPRPRRDVTRWASSQMKISD